MSDLKGKPLHERIIIEPIESPAKTSGGIYIPQEARDAPTLGIVKAVGNLVNKEGVELKVGDKVLFIRHAGFPVEIDGKSYRMILCNDVIFVFDEEIPAESV